ncbi:hypothetical protein N7509_013904 [Penicillium cosmopolitanum]|uniref:Zn(2)-C6 fungal-type domain-containing protein n=1 Tax=Penicillium cosmopolitanum TaxID=1131564 RepID=A0A9W9VCG7_9EURO|nr:uncharacterized protein N7509_013904 [Penicillium cosmopolitanum]KAJ5377018.1 hypothetical protein N7509_013904 [Penicillium cosmopolitanum]
MSSGIQRKRLACVECTRRKIKCDKTVPCRNCTRKGTQCSRAQARDSPSLEVARPDTQAGTSLFPQSTSEAYKIIDGLKSKINCLEAELSAANEAATRARTPTPSYHFSSTTYSPANSLVYHPIAGSVSNSSKASSIQTPNEVEDAATILEFLAWGRRKDPSYQDDIAKRNDMPHSPGDLPVEDDWNGLHTSGLSMMSFCELLLPIKQKVHELVTYHCECLLWYHGAFHATTFLQELEDFYARAGGRIDGSGVDLQWMSLLFAVLTGSIASAPTATTQAWGFRDQEKRALSHRWLKASVACLHQANYMACHSVYAVQAIATLTISAHMLGKSNSFSVLLAAAIRIAQGLGLHQLDADQESTSCDPLSQEIGRRIWCQLCIQDWFSIPFTESYLIHRKCFNTERPGNCDNHLIPISEDQPTVTGYSRLFYNIAYLMPGLYDDFTSSNTLYTRYEEVLKYDRRLRTLATQHLPRYLQNVPLDPSWPSYVPWARRSLAISSSHKVIMIHRKFLSLSFVNPMFEFTRKTCVAASRTIIKEQKEATLENGPVLWIHQAFSVTASIILCLDMFHRPTADSQSSQNRQFVEDGIAILSHCDSDMIARRGVPLIKAMLQAEERRSGSPDSHEAQAFDKAGMGLNIASIIQTFYKKDRSGLSGDSPDIPPVESSTRTLGDLLMPFGVDYAEGLDDILSLATNCLN